MTDAHRCVGLCDAIFGSDYEQMINRLCEHPQSQYEYIKKLIELKSDQIRDAVRGFILHKQLNLEP